MFDISKIDPKIREWVLFLRENNFITISSCQGCGISGTTHSHCPEVIIEESPGKTLDETLETLIKLVGSKPIIKIIGGSSTFPRKIRFLPPYEIIIQSPKLTNL